MSGTLILGDNSLEATLQEHQASVAEVSKVLKQLTVVLGYEVGPQENRVLLLWTVCKQVVSPNFAWDSCLFGIITEDTCLSGLRELLWLSSIFVDLIVQELSCRNCLKHGPALM